MTATLHIICDTLQSLAIILNLLWPWSIKGRRKFDIFLDPLLVALLPSLCVYVCSLKLVTSLFFFSPVPCLLRMFRWFAGHVSRLSILVHTRLYCRSWFYSHVSGFVAWLLFHWNLLHFCEWLVLDCSFSYTGFVVRSAAAFPLASRKVRVMKFGVKIACGRSLIRGSDMWNDRTKEANKR